MVVHIQEMKGEAIKRTISTRALAVALALTLAGCGGGGGSSSVNAVVPSSAQPHAAASTFTVTADDYGLQNATYLAATTSQQGMVLRAAIASSMTDPAFRSTVRIDIDHSAAIVPGVYALGGSASGAPALPGAIYFFDGHSSTLLETVGGSITFTSFGVNPGDLIAGSFSATVKDGNDSAGSTYSVSANFSFSVDTSGAVTPAAAPVPAGAAALYDTHCAGCHSLGSYDPTANGGSDVALKGGRLRTLMAANTVSHQGVQLAASEISALKVLLNAN